MRGDFVTVAMPGDFGKPRPAMIIPVDPFGGHATVPILPVMSALVAAPPLRVTVQPSAENRLRTPRQAMADNTIAVKRDNIEPVFGRIPAETMVESKRRLAVFLGIAT